MIKHDSENILKQNIPLKILIYSKSQFDVITKSSQMSEKRLMIDIAVAREAYRNTEICDIGHIRTLNNPAHDLTKSVDFQCLNNILSIGFCEIEVYQ